MPRNTESTDGTPAPRPPRQRKPSAKTKNQTLPKLPEPDGAHAGAALPSVLSGLAHEGLVARIHELEDRLNQQTALLTERCAELDALKAGGVAKEVLQDRIREQDELLRGKETALSEIEQSFEAELRAAHAQIEMQKDLLTRREGDLERLQALLQERVAEEPSDQSTIDRAVAETARLIAEQREAKLALAKFEIDEWYTIRRKNSWNRLVATMRRWFEKAPRDSE